MSDREPVSVSIEDAPAEIEQTPQATNLSEVVLQGDDVPDLVRGKTAAEAVATIRALSESLKLSEEARKQAELTAATALKTQPAPAPAPAEEPEMSEEELAQMFSENPLQTIRVMSDRALQKAEKNLERRLQPLFSGSSANAETQARSKYADEFALFGQEITQTAAQIPNSQAVLANPQAWDDLIALVRGRPHNLEKLIAHKTATSAVQQRQNAQQQQDLSIGFNGTEPRTARAPTKVTHLDPIQLEIAEKMGMSPEDYVRWSQV